jgi:3D (Asp-Asp-Asp) domain-containing protein
MKEEAKQHNKDYIYKFDGIVTAYYNSPSETGKSPGDPDWGMTASGTKARVRHTIAASHSLPFHSVVRIEGLDGEYYVEDRGGAIKGSKVDLFVSNKKEADNWGVQNRTIYVIKLGGKDE